MLAWTSLVVSAVSMPLGAQSEAGAFTIEGSAGMQLSATPMERFDAPWAMTFLPDGRLLVTEKAGRLKLVDLERGAVASIAGVPDTRDAGQGGLGDVVLHPDFAENSLVYLSYVEHDGDTSGSVVMRGRLRLDASNPRLEAPERLWEQVPKVSGSGHYSQRIAFDEDGLLYITSGERQHEDPAQDLRQNLGKIVRLAADGSPPPDNPFADRGETAAEVWTLGHRNPLGIAFDANGTLWAHEMGPRGGDELNRIVAGENYGWPEVSDGRHYSFLPIPDHDTTEEYRAPVISWVPSVSPAGLVIYDADRFAAWQGDALFGALSGQALVHVELSDDTAREVERFEWGARVREVEQGPDGALWVLEDGSDARLLRITPAG